MSVGVTVHESVPATSSVAPNPLADLEAVRKNANEKLRIRRLVQVRQQSKELAAKVRQNYQQAKAKELAKIEQIKKEELRAWKRRHIRQLQDEYARCIGDVGEAHKAAEAAEECAVWFEERRAMQQAAALHRGRQAEAAVARERERKEAKAQRKKPPYVPSKSVAVQAAIPEQLPPEEPEQQEESEPSTEPTPSCPYEVFRSRRLRASEEAPAAAAAAISSESEDDSMLLCAGTRDKENIPNRRTGEYSATAFTSPSELRPTVEQAPPPPPPLRPLQRLQPFTQITELIQQRRQRDLGNDGYSHHATQKAVQFDDVSENTLSFPTSSVLDERTCGSRDESPRKHRPRKLVDQPKVFPVQLAAAPATAAKQPIAKRGQASLPSIAPVAVSSSTSNTATASYDRTTSGGKVQYYDYSTRFSREYDQPAALVQREERRGNDPTAMEEANRYEKLQQELASARSKMNVDRTKPALEKQQTRKDYEKLSKELDQLTRAENKVKSLAAPTKTIPTEATMKQQAETRQRKANEAIETLLQQRAIVTCPVVRLTDKLTTSARQDVGATRTPMVNVAEIPSHSTNEGPEKSKDLSSDSCASIVLGTFERPAIPLPAAAPVGDKVGRVEGLLEQITEQCRLLTEEIVKERTAGVAVEKDSVEQLVAGMQKNTGAEKLERLKRRQEELIEQQRRLRKREREVEELERQLREKMALLGRRDKQRAESGETKRAGRSASVHVKDPKKAIEVEVEQAPETTVTSNSEEGGTDSTSVGDAPVKIIITVNEKSPSKRKHRKKTIKKTVEIVEKQQQEQRQLEEKDVPKKATPPVEEKKFVEIPPSLTKGKEEMTRPSKRPTVARIAEMNFSPGSTSTTSTVYRELPPKIGGLKINRLLGPGAPPTTEATKAPPGPKHQLQRQEQQRPVAREKPPPKNANLNPHLLKYIQRLLGMSRQSIEQLGVSSSTTVSTPNASVMEVSGNVGPPAAAPAAATMPDEEQEIDRANRMAKFIEENYNFLQEIDETLKRSEHSSVRSEGVSDSFVDDPDVSRVEDVWMRTLRSREREMKKKATVQREVQVVAPKPKKKPARKRQEGREGPPPTAIPAPEPVQPAPEAPEVRETPPSNAAPPTLTTKEASLKSILKSPKRDASPKVAKIITPQGHVEIINLSDREEQEILERYSQLTERCSQRITELSQMISQVREEKRRLIEDSLSSLDQQDSSTKYMDLPSTLGRPPPPAEQQQQQQTVREPRESVVPVPSPAPGDPMSEEIDNIFSSSKQIGLSKDSGIAMSRPLTASDIRESPSEDCSHGKEPLPFEPFLKDIVRPVPSVVATPAASMRLVPVPVSSTAPGGRKPPPVAITRYSPLELEEMPVHELSTILEVDTPAVAAAGPSSSSKVYDVSTLSVAGERSDAAKERVLIEARNKLLLQEEKDEEEEEQEAPQPAIAYERFPQFEEYVNVSDRPEMDLESAEVGGGNGVADTALRLDVTEADDRLRYRSFPEAAPSFNLTEEEPGSGKSDGGENCSLPDVVTELIKRNIIQKPFNQSLDNSNRSTPLSEGRQPRQQQGVPEQKESEQQEQELFDMLAGDLVNVAGLRWASSMLRKNQQQKSAVGGGNEQRGQSTTTNSSSSSSSSPGIRPPTPGRGESDDNVVSGKPLNLAKFISRELVIRSHTDLQSLSCSSELSSSPGSHSALLRSLLSISNLDHTTTSDSPVALLATTTSADARSNVHQRTSTPVASKSNSGSSSAGARSGAPDAGTTTAIDNRNEAYGQLFSGESHLSSVHWSSSSGGSEAHGGGGSPMRLSAPDVRLQRRGTEEGKQGKEAV